MWPSIFEIFNLLILGVVTVILWLRTMVSPRRSRLILSVMIFPIWWLGNVPGWYVFSGGRDVNDPGTNLINNAWLGGGVWQLPQWWLTIIFLITILLAAIGGKRWLIRAIVSFVLVPVMAIPAIVSADYQDIRFGSSRSGHQTSTSQVDCDSPIGDYQDLAYKATVANEKLNHTPAQSPARPGLELAATNANKKVSNKQRYLKDINCAPSDKPDGHAQDKVLKCTKVALYVDGAADAFGGPIVRVVWNFHDADNGNATVERTDARHKFRVDHTYSDGGVQDYQAELFDGFGNFYSTSGETAYLNTCPVKHHHKS